MASLLVLDSDATAREALAEALRLRGYRVRTAPTKPSKASSSAIPKADLVVLGLADVEQAKAVAPVLDGAPIIVCAATRAPVDALTGADVVAWFPKPTDVAKLLDFIEGYVRGRRFRVWSG